VWARRRVLEYWGGGGRDVCGYWDVLVGVYVKCVCMWGGLVIIFSQISCRESCTVAARAAAVALKQRAAWVLPGT
jgi:hypothetical protein